MVVLIDTNVIVDVMTKREPHYGFSASFMKTCGPLATGCLLASQTTDIFYLLRRAGRDADSAKDIIKKLADNLKILDVTHTDVQNSLEAEMLDFEDALLACRAERKKADYIITRNEKDFALSRVPALSPQKFLEQFGKSL